MLQEKKPLPLSINGIFSYTLLTTRKKKIVTLHFFQKFPTLGLVITILKTFFWKKKF